MQITRREGGAIQPERGRCAEAHEQGTERQQAKAAGVAGKMKRRWATQPEISGRLFGALFAGLALAALLGFGPRAAQAQTDCLMCHGDKTMQDANGHSIAVDGKTFGDSVHGALGCNACHADIKEYPHPDHIAKVDCKTCHSDEAAALGNSVHKSSKDHP